MKTRSEAIKTALRQYNEAAARLIPPRPQLSWSNVLNAATVADFDLLRDTRTDIRLLPWTEPSRRDAIKYYFGIKRAKEEIVRLNVEITRLLTFMFDSHVDYYRAIQVKVVQDPSLGHCLSMEWQYLNRIHEKIVQKLVQTSKLMGFTGTLSIGSRIGRDTRLRTNIPNPTWFVLLEDARLCDRKIMQDTDSLGQEAGSDDEDEVPRELGVGTDTIVELLERISTSDSS